MSLREHVVDRLPPTDFKHVTKYPARLAANPEILGQPLAFGINWYQAFDAPTEIVIGGHKTYWIGLGPQWGVVRGGHCICGKPVAVKDTAGWYTFYDQGSEGACVGFGESRMMSLLNRKRYDARWLYHEARKVDEWPGEDYDGTSLRAGFDILRTVGHRRKWGPVTLPPMEREGIAANRWLLSVDEIMAVLGTATLHGGCVPFLNSWGLDYPHTVYIPAEAMGRLLIEDGECGAVTDR